MYNRYIGNTGKVFRIDDRPPNQQNNKQHDQLESSHNPHPDLQKHSEKHDEILAHDKHQNGFNLSKLLSGGSLLKYIDAILPFGIDTADLILLILLFFLYIESGDEEFLIILGFLLYSFYSDYKESKS